MRYKTVLIDPPWDYIGYKQYQGWDYAPSYRIRPQYNVMSIDQIKKLPVPDLLSKNSHLYLWTTNVFMKEAIEIVEYWGLSWKDILTWIKNGMGMGWYYRVSTEHIIFAVKGHLRTKKRNTLNYFYAKRGRHSVKPEKSYKIIEANSYSPRLELFARKKRKYWDVWGNEVKSDIRIKI